MKNIIVTIYLFFLYALLLFWIFAMSISILWDIITEYPLIYSLYYHIIALLVLIFIFCSIILIHHTKKKPNATIKNYIVASVPFVFAILIYFLSRLNIH